MSLGLGTSTGKEHVTVNLQANYGILNACGFNLNWFSLYFSDTYARTRAHYKWGQPLDFEERYNDGEVLLKQNRTSDIDF